MKKKQLFKLGAGAGLATMLLGALMMLAPGAGATKPAGHKVTICHRTNSVTNPYRIITVDVSSLDGEGKNDHDHHDGPAFDFTGATTYDPPFNGDDWGDIIPPFSKGGDSYPGKNWVEGKTLNEQCLGEVPDAPTYSIVVDKVNNADGQPGFNDLEQAPSAAASVSFRLTITNDGDALVTVESVTDTWPGQDAELDILTVDGLTCETDGGAAEVVLNGLVLAPDASVVCDFTLPTYSPAAGGGRTNTITVDTEEGANDVDTSTVTTPEGPPPCVRDCTPPPPPCVDNCTPPPPPCVDNCTPPPPPCVRDCTPPPPPCADNCTPPPPPCVDNCTPPPPPPAVTDVCPELLGPQVEVDECPVEVEGVVVPNKPTPKPDVKPDVKPAPQKTEAVLGVQTVRALPRTGDETGSLAGAGALMLALGAALVLASKRQLSR